MNKSIKQSVLKSKYIPTTDFYSQIIDSLQDYSIFTLDNDLRINSWSSGSSKIFGYETDEVIGNHFDFIFTEEDKENGIPQKEIDTALKEGRAVDNRWHVCKDGSKFYAYGLVFPFLGSGGENFGYVKILRDLTERKKSEEAINKYIKELEELNTHKESLLAILSHDLRSPLGTIIMGAEYLQQNIDTMPPEDVKKMIGVIHKASTNELTMLDYLVEWARIKYASEIFSPSEIELVSFVNEIFESFKEVAAANTIKLMNEIQENTTVFADRKMVISVFQNIISNAIKHCPKEGTIVVSAESKEDKVVVQIKDNGAGMSKEIIEKLFTPQLSALSKARKENKGAGLGLLLVKGFLERNGGEIWVESIEGQGSSFFFTLPKNKVADNTNSREGVKFDENG
jgi:PAS domain S-box-containing protein